MSSAACAGRIVGLDVDDVCMRTGSRLSIVRRLPDPVCRRRLTTLLGGRSLWLLWRRRCSARQVGLQYRRTSASASAATPIASLRDRCWIIRFGLDETPRRPPVTDATAATMREQRRQRLRMSSLRPLRQPAHRYPTSALGLGSRPAAAACWSMWDTHGLVDRARKRRGAASTNKAG